ncbi:hypothetical protein C2G38_2071495 [Gigaspora rosea]|uniref:Uncharacterized protein n=1 Tax=Gigaspora rosea TaxID=44941 RepID=A0A397VS84_9GLOM|nr:hypothetical protein C2G38_2071495 [Gigaspora rosea]
MQILKTFKPVLFHYSIYQKAVYILIVLIIANFMLSLLVSYFAYCYSLSLDF